VFSNRKQGNKYLQNILLTPHYFRKTHRIAMQLSMGDFKEGYGLNLVQGAIDGIHVFISKPSKFPKDYFYHKA
jgi:hypothetical protein